MRNLGKIISRARNAIRSHTCWGQLPAGQRNVAATRKETQEQRSDFLPRACTTCGSVLEGKCHTSGYLENVRMWTGFQNKLLVILAVFNVQLFFFSCGFLFPIKHLEEFIKLGDDVKVESVF